ncbi:hypothetical protein ACNHYB_10410 [Isoptericola jiangsuensis]|uniref:hypothetical protein n=1 Tax=Isoptericola jiangsuensis TaxID=548579 RepID=UPI003AABFB70
MTRLVLIHGRDQGGLEPDGIEDRWIDALNAGLAASGSTLRLTDDDATFVYYGDTLAALDDGSDTGAVDPAPPVTVHAFDAGSPTTHRLLADEARFALAVVHEILIAAEISPDAQADDVHAPPAGPAPTDPAPTDPAPATAARPSAALDGSALDGSALDGSALAVALARALAALDRYVPGLSGAVVLLALRDVYTYLHDDEARAAVDAGVLAALATDEPAVVVAHSLGSVIAYQVLRSQEAGGLDVPLLVTLGSPLAIRAVREAVTAIAPPGWPAPVDRWVAVRDPRDLLSLHDLTPRTFPLEPPGPGVENTRVDNPVPGHHAAAAQADGVTAGYAATPEVGSLLDAALAP